VNLHTGAEPPLAQADLLPPPRIEAIALDFYQGKVGDEVMLAISDDFGLVSVYVVIQDERGNLIESGNADAFEAGSACWSYIATVPVESGTRVIVHAAATDCLGGVGALRTGTTIP